MKVAIPTSGSDLQGSVGAQFGRADKIMVVDSVTLELTIIENTKNLNASQGAGIQTAQKVSESGAEWLLTGHCGPKAFRVLAAAGIQVAVGVTGTIAEVMKRFAAGKFQAAETADVEGHWA